MVNLLFFVFADVIAASISGKRETRCIAFVMGENTNNGGNEGISRLVGKYPIALEHRK